MGSPQDYNYGLYKRVPFKDFIGFYDGVPFTIITTGSISGLPLRNFCRVLQWGSL